MFLQRFKNDEKFQEKVFSKLQKGVKDQNEIERQLNEEEEIERLREEAEDESLRDEVRVIAQALAFRVPSLVDAKDITKLINAAYRPEIIGDEAFRNDEKTVSEELINDMLSQDSPYKWLICEAPRGYELEEDGVMLGVCCFSTDGISRKDSEVEGHLGSIRYFAVKPRFHGVLVGTRLLKRVEESMKIKYQCCRIMVSIPEPRDSVCLWVERHGFDVAGTTKYPAKGLGHTLKKTKAQQLKERKEKHIKALAEKAKREKDEAMKENSKKENENGESNVPPLKENKADNNNKTQNQSENNIDNLPESIKDHYASGTENVVEEKPQAPEEQIEVGLIMYHKSLGTSNFVKGKDGSTEVEIPNVD